MGAFEQIGQGVAELDIQEVHDSVMGLQEFVLATTDRTSVPDDTPLPACGKYLVPAELLRPDRDLDVINNSGPILVEALTDPVSAHQAIDSLLAIDTIFRVEPELNQEISRPLKVFNLMDVLSLDRIMDGPDTALTAKVLRLICHRADAGEFGGQLKFRRYLPKIIAAGDKDNGPEGTLLYNDFLDTLAAQASEAGNGPGPRAVRLFPHFMTGLGYDAHDLEEAWAPSRSSRSAVRQNRRKIKALIALERRKRAGQSILE